MDLGRFWTPENNHGVQFQPNIAPGQFEHVYSVLLALSKANPNAVIYSEESFEQKSLQIGGLTFRERVYNSRVEKDVKIRLCDVDCSQGSLGSDVRLSQSVELNGISFKADDKFKRSLKKRYQFAIPRENSSALWVDMTETVYPDDLQASRELQIEMELRTPHINLANLTDFINHAVALAQTAVDVLHPPEGWTRIQLFQDDELAYNDD